MDIADVKQSLYEGREVTYNGFQYIFKACILRYGNNGFYYQAELRDLNAKMVMIAPLDAVEAAANNGII